MRLTSDLSDSMILAELGSRIARYRLNRNQTQKALALAAGISEPTVARLERGHSVQFSSILRVLRALDLIENLDEVAPRPSPSPIHRLRTEGKDRRRASTRGDAATSGRPWTWADDA